jgi:hypothetical protein
MDNFISVQEGVKAPFWNCWCSERERERETERGRGFYKNCRGISLSLCQSVYLFVYTWEETVQDQRKKFQKIVNKETAGAK